MPAATGRRWCIACAPSRWNDPAHAGVAVNAAERKAHGIYYSELVFDRAHPGEWDFPANIGA